MEDGGMYFILKDNLNDFLLILYVHERMCIMSSFVSIFYLKLSDNWVYVYMPGFFGL